MRCAQPSLTEAAATLTTENEFLSLVLRLEAGCSDDALFRSIVAASASTPIAKYRHLLPFFCHGVIARSPEAVPIKRSSDRPANCFFRQPSDPERCRGTKRFRKGGRPRPNRLVGTQRRNVGTFFALRYSIFVVDNQIFVVALIFRTIPTRSLCDSRRAIDSSVWHKFPNFSNDLDLLVLRFSWIMKVLSCTVL